jgi:tetratricopeptide (TPR) repeat protein
MKPARLLCALVLASLLAGCNTPQRRSALISDGERAFAARNYPEAVRTMSEVLRDAHGEEAARAAYVRGMANALQGRRAEAYADLQTATRSGGGSLTWQPHGMLGTLLFEDERWPDAARELSATIDILRDQSPADAYLWRLGLCQERSGQWSAALSSYDRLVRAFPSANYAGQARRRLRIRADSFAVQCGVFRQSDNANALVAQLRQNGFRPEVRNEERPDGTVLLVLEGRYANHGQATQALARVRGYISEAVLWP